ncbi:HAMP domain-containing histidine kinase [Agromyces atrinae]|uniref:histidine kinase n=1 Tax=Agromyces atrinae TaxID=592376 RepID=A0A4Q2LZM3_9MICO|nr:ATP-binding protein [Agromyces atrinae]MCI2959179.1 HAMP domain-containing histidine kinase [Agromyces atrinae]NYD65605.1 signal transduction histidine kinase [Agromyces atrinae]RXZ85005.1 PAS domain-containing protein [Agromyces atrinae]
MSPSDWLSRVVTFDSNKPGIRQLASVLGILLSLLAILVVPSARISAPFYAWSGVALVLVLGVVAYLVPWDRIASTWVLVIPLGTMLGFGLFRTGTGGATSMFGALIILPVVWIAAEEGRRYIWIAALATNAALLLPYFVGEASWYDGQVIRGYFAPIVYLVVAAVINELAHRARVQLAAMRQLAEERSRRLLESEKSAGVLRRTQERLRASEDFNKSVWAAAIHEAVIVTDLSGGIVAWGPGAAAMLGPVAESTEGTRSLVDFIDRERLLAAHGLTDCPDEQDSETIFTRFVEATERSGGSTSELGLVTVDGVVVPVHISCSPRRSGDGTQVGHIFIAADITQANEVARLKDEFVGMISHELRTPLSSILGYIELVRDDEAPLTDEQLHYLGVAERNAHRLLDLVGDLLFAAQVEAGKFPLELTTVDVGAIVTASAESAVPVAQRSNIAVHVEIDDSDLDVHGDATRLGQAYDNLLSNAIKFTPAGGSVTIRAVREHSEIVVEIVDTGMGIPADEMDKLFTRFFRSTTSTRQAVQGVGLGLNITKAIVAAHRGTLGASSIEGEGTTFEIRLPVASDEPAPEAVAGV